MGATPASDEGRLGMTGGAARACAAHPWRTVAAWVALAVVSMGITSVFLADLEETGRAILTFAAEEALRLQLNVRVITFFIDGSRIVALV